jgi:hypothetical protein
MDFLKTVNLRVQYMVTDVDFSLLLTFFPQAPTTDSIDVFLFPLLAAAATGSF